MQFQVVQGSIPCEVISYYDHYVSQHTDSDVLAWLGLKAPALAWPEAALAWSEAALACSDPRPWLVYVQTSSRK